MAAARKKAARRNTRKAKTSRSGPDWVLRGGYALLVFFFLGVLADWIWLGAVAEQVRLYLLPVLWALAGWAVHRRRWLTAGLVALATLLAGVHLWPLLRPVDGAPSRGPTLRVTTLSLEGARPSGAQLARWLRAEPADLIVLSRAPYRAERRIHSSAGFRALTVRPWHEGEDETLTLLTRLPLARRPVRGKDGAARTSLRVDRCNVQLTYVALPSVWDAAHSSSRRVAFESFETPSSNGARVWIGDFGGDLRAPGPRAFLERARLRDSRVGRGLNATWPRVLGPLGIAMDHVLVGDWVAVRERTTGPPPGDGSRRSARATLQLTSPRCAEP